MHFVSALTDKRKLSDLFRARRVGHLVGLIASVLERQGKCAILDIGGTEEYWRHVGYDFLTDNRVSILLTNVYEMPVQRGDIFSFRLVDGRRLPFADNAFDLAHSNSVIEHVGDWDDMANFAAELRRVARAYYVQTPNFWFPWEPHFATPFFHWLPEPTRVALIQRWQLGYRPRCGSVDEAVRSVQGAHLLSGAMLSALFPDARIVPERVAGLTKSFMALRAGAA